jgi:hypothetical protein
MIHIISFNNTQIYIIYHQKNPKKYILKLQTSFFVVSFSLSYGTPQSKFSIKIYDRLKLR